MLINLVDKKVTTIKPVLYVDNTILLVYCRILANRMISNSQNYLLECQIMCNVINTYMHDVVKIYKLAKKLGKQSAHSALVEFYLKVINSKINNQEVVEFQLVEEKKEM